MNASVELVYQSPRIASKQYRMRLFTNGQLQIPGVTDCYNLSEVPFLVNQLIRLCSDLSGNEVTEVSRRVVLCNFTSDFGLNKKQLNTVAIHREYREDPKRFNDVCFRLGL
jgi:hypothetical protein